MRLVKFNAPDRGEITVNADLVSFVEELMDRKNKTDIHSGGGKVRVLCGYEDVCNMIWPGASDHGFEVALADADGSAAAAGVASTPGGAEKKAGNNSTELDL